VSRTRKEYIQLIDTDIIDDNRRGRIVDKSLLLRNLSITPTWPLNVNTLLGSRADQIRYEGSFEK
jgi:hypothetical protein